MRHQIPIWFVVLIVLIACDSSLVNTFKDLATISESVSDTLGTDEVQVTISNGTVLQMTATNSSLNSASAKQRQEAAERAAVIAGKKYSASQKLENVSVAFVAVETKYLIVTYTEHVDSYRFTKKRLAVLSSKFDVD